MPIPSGGYGLVSVPGTADVRFEAHYGESDIALSPKCQESTDGQLPLISLGLRRVVSAGLRVADGVGQHLAQLSLRLRWFPTR
jgi:hypothetical protein